ncbi:hypothetical protein ASPVEDRAFT_45906 [Aspergillus versicolor CBS 583.65]|uniref:Uncharacterized protein n=1 Tax=Aspergillus versicolor CBS 583.65 TaxID=1036611 RepID=A0A1L9PYD3_ASPVE|nr:uncharacterized protein ASPVEDRAFT_45906 [Aspergillus versicolor CBS 583.65]OJJ06549.1 hypothetical protein ASPVEDRAFT_45906 [Aspergillus versicolor CBS 583.65]
MKISWLFVSLGLSAAPALAEPIATLDLKSVAETWAEHPESGECLPNWTIDVPVDYVNVKPEAHGVVCSFFPEADCKGQGTALTDGEYEFNGDFYFRSFGCVEWVRKEA